MLDPIAIHLGPIAIRWYALCIVTGLILAVYLTMKEAPRKKIIPDDILDFILIAFPLAILGARLYYVIFRFDYYSQNLGEIFAIWNGGLAIYGGLITGALVLYIFADRKLINTWDFLDIAAPSVMIAQSLGRWGNFFNQEAYGAAVDNLDYLPGFIRDQMYIEGSYRQPTFLYESLWNLLGFALILIFRRKWKSLRRGHITAFYLIWYGFGRMVIEGMRTDSLMFFGLRVSQWLSVVLIGLGIFIILYQNRKKAPYYVTEVAYILVALALIVFLVYLIITVQKLGRVIDETEKTIKTLTSDVDVTLHHTNELLAKVNVLADDINVKVATIDPLFSAVADLSLSVSDLNDHARVLSKKASSAGSKTLKTGASLSALRLASKFFKK